MAAEPLEIAAVFRRFLGPYQERYGPLKLPSHRRAVRDILGCMTEAMGGGRYQCRQCQQTFWSYHGCRNRACPKCHGRQIVLWMEKRTAELLPCAYFHLVSTLPADLRSFCLGQQKLLYGLFMKTVAAALQELALEKRHLGGIPGILAVLHTWTTRMLYHPHVHLLATGGGLSPDGASWRSAARDYLVPVRKLSVLIRKRFAESLREQRPDLFARIPPEAWSKEWCSFCKPVGKGREAVVRYLARYVFRLAITNHRLVRIGQTHVTFRYKENRSGLWKTERITGVEFIRRFLLHVLPQGFHKVRYYGLWSAPKKKQCQALHLQLQIVQQQDIPATPRRLATLAEEALSRSELESHAFVVKCPACKSTTVTLVERLRRGGWPMIL